jgi:arylformamidase
MIDECAAALATLVHTFAPTHVTLSGSSAGAHLAAHTALRCQQMLDRLILLSGVYDLRPLVNTYINEPLQLDDTRAAALSILASPRPVDQILVVYGDNETDAFKHQSDRLAAAWAVPSFQVTGRNHFDLLCDLSRMHLGEIPE